MRHLKPAAAACFLLLICLSPSTALDAASSSLSAWALSVAPSLLPFLIASPALTSPEVCSILSRLCGPVMHSLKLPRNAAGALFIGLLSGSPAGAGALISVPATPDNPPGAYLRAAIFASGASPAFLLSGVAVGILNAPEAGWMLLRSQMLSALASVLLLRSAGKRSAPPVGFSRPQHSAVLSAALTLLSIAGYMVLFSVLARQLSLLWPASETPLLALFELAGGCRALSALPLPAEVLLPLISAAACFGGLSVYAQSMSFLAQAGIGYGEYAAGKLLHAAIAALFTYLQLTRPWQNADPLLLTFLLLSALLVALMLRTAFLWRHSASDQFHP